MDKEQKIICYCSIFLAANHMLVMLGKPQLFFVLHAVCSILTRCVFCGDSCCVCFECFVSCLLRVLFCVVYCVLYAYCFCVDVFWLVLSRCMVLLLVPY